MGGTHMAPDTQVHTVERKIGEPVFRFETGRLAQQADGAVLAQVGETTVLVAATASRGAREGVDFFPLTVDVEERMYAAGKIPGGFFRRDGRRNEDGGAGILMVEAGATEIALDLVEAGAPEMTEELVAEGLEEAKTWILEAIAHQEELVAQAGRRTPAKTWVIAPPYDSVLSDRVSSNARDRIVALISEADKQTRESGLDELSAEVVAGLEAEFPDRAREIDGVFRKLVKALVRERIVNDGKRIDGRGLRDIRPISCDVGILPRLHGTGLFNRGQTQVLSTVTLGMLRMEQMLDDLGVAESKRYMHHYNFPPFSTG